MIKADQKYFKYKIEKKYFFNKIYCPKLIEKKLYKFWEINGFFLPSDKYKENFCIVIPPPNITGNLHIGHAFQQTFMDIIIRYQRMLGKNTLWQYGTDHAGIATQMIVEKNILKQKKQNIYKISKQKFIKQIWKWKKKYSKNISAQIKRLGHSIDWSRERFTMDKKFSEIVKKAFVHLYNDNLIYRGIKIVNWDPKLKTAVSDLEIVKKISKEKIWYVKYILADNLETKDNKKYLIISTSKPETIFADIAVAVHPDDIRYQDLIGKYLILPLLNCKIPIIGDKKINMNKETGCLRITPGHDFHSYEIAKKNSLSIIRVFDFCACMLNKVEVLNSSGEEWLFYRNIPICYHGIDRFKSRKIIINEIKKLKLLHDVKIKEIDLFYADRSDVIVEPMITNQWYIKTKFLAKDAILAVKNKKIQFISKQYENMYFSWMKNIKDWCISRQLHWGHRIPVWYDLKKNVYVGINEKDIRKKYNIFEGVELFQETDVLDTWFSSSLWTFATLGWLQNEKTLKQFHPTDVLITGFDIIFFWVSRMIMMTMYFIKDKNGNGIVPFKKIYITGLIRDKYGEKMSKTKGNVLDPIDIIDGISLEELLKKRINEAINSEFVNKIISNTKKEYPNGIKSFGADSLRFAFCSISSSCRDINLDLSRLDGYRNFCNKLWNASRFIFINCKNINYKNNDKLIYYSFLDKWIISKFNDIIKLYKHSLDNFRFDMAANVLYDFLWHDFCDWYIELSKKIIFSEDKNNVFSIRHTLIKVLENFLKLAHPIIPFITEIIWQNIKNFNGSSGRTIMLEKFPCFDKQNVYVESVFLMNWVKKIIINIRNIKLEKGININEKLDIFIKEFDINKRYLIEKNIKFVIKISSLNSITLLDNDFVSEPSIILYIDNSKLFIPKRFINNKK